MIGIGSRALPTRQFRAMASVISPSRRLALAERLRQRLIGSIRRERVDHLVVLGEEHLRRILTKYAAYYNELRTHRSLGKDAPPQPPDRWRLDVLLPDIIHGAVHRTHREFFEVEQQLLIER